MAGTRPPGAKGGPGWEWDTRHGSECPFDTSTLSPWCRGGGDGAFPARWRAPAKPERRPPLPRGHRPPAPSGRQRGCLSLAKPRQLQKGKMGGGRRSHKARPEVCDLQEPAGSNSGGRVGSTPSASHLTKLPRDTDSTGAPCASATGTKSSHGREENTQNKPYVHPKPTTPHLDEGTWLPRCPSSPSAVRFWGGCLRMAIEEHAPQRPNIHI